MKEELTQQEKTREPMEAIMFRVLHMRHQVVLRSNNGDSRLFLSCKTCHEDSPYKWLDVK